MALDTLRRSLLFIIFTLVQALVLGRIHLFHCATPLLYVYFIIMLPRNYPRWASLLWGFALGLAIDIFNNTPGVTAAALTLTAFIQPYLLELFLPRDAEEDIKSSAAQLGRGNFYTLAFILVLIYCFNYFTVEAFSFFNWTHWLLCIGASTLLTYILIVTLETLRK